MNAYWEAVHVCFFLRSFLNLLNEKSHCYLIFHCHWCFDSIYGEIFYCLSTDLSTLATHSDFDYCFDFAHCFDFDYCFDFDLDLTLYEYSLKTNITKCQSMTRRILEQNNNISQKSNNSTHFQTQHFANSLWTVLFALVIYNIIHVFISSHNYNNTGLGKINQL